MYIELHMLQNFAPSCLNRDDLNSPKDCQFGGVRRARISSQCQKRAIRLDDIMLSGRMKRATRTRRLHECVEAELIKRGKSEQEVKELKSLIFYLLCLIFKKDGDREQTKVAIYIDDYEVKALTDFLMLKAKELRELKEAFGSDSNDDESTDVGEADEASLEDLKAEKKLIVEKINQCKKECSAAKKSKSSDTPALESRMESLKTKKSILENQIKTAEQIFKQLSPAKKELEKIFSQKARDLRKKSAEQKESMAVDLALFGRMIAEINGANIDAACQVAHAISTHAVSPELDFFTAVDDLQPKSDPGAGMLGTQEFNSPSLYRYANIDLGQLVHNLNDDTELAKEAVIAFVKAAVLAIPSAKQNSHAAHQLPDFALCTVRTSGPLMSLSNAFAKPVSPSRDKSITCVSAETLAKYWEKLNNAYGDVSKAESAWYGIDIPEDLDLTGTAKVKGLTEMLDWLRQELNKPGNPAQPSEGK